MAHFLNTAQAYGEIENIIVKCENRLVLISPYIQMPKKLLNMLSDVGEKRGVNITLVCRRKRLKSPELKILKRIKRLEILDLPNVHAKCFYNEDSMVITSLNLLEYSIQKSREMGLLLNKEEDLEAFNDARAEAEFIIETAYLVKPNKLLAREYRKRNPLSYELRQLFPTFAKLFGSKEE